MRILCLNANTTPHITALVGDEMRRTLGSSAQVDDCTPTFGTAVIKTRVDLAVATHAVVDAAAQHTDVDAIMLAVSFDTGRDALREALDIPVVGMSEASVAVARMHGSNIGYVSMGTNMTNLYHESLPHCNLGFDMAGWQAIDVPSAYQPGDTTELDTAISTASNELVKQGADVIVLLGAVLAGAAYRINKNLSVPAVDGGAAGAILARSLVDLGMPKATSGSFAKATSGGLSGVSVALSDLQR